MLRKRRTCNRNTISRKCQLGDLTMYGTFQHCKSVAPGFTGNVWVYFYLRIHTVYRKRCHTCSIQFYNASPTAFKLVSPRANTNSCHAKPSRYRLSPQACFPDSVAAVVERRDPEAIDLLRRHAHPHERPERLESRPVAQLPVHEQPVSAAGGSRPQHSNRFQAEQNMDAQ